MFLVYESIFIHLFRINFCQWKYQWSITSHFIKVVARYVWTYVTRNIAWFWRYFKICLSILSMWNSQMSINQVRWYWCQSFFQVYFWKNKVWWFCFSFWHNIHQIDSWVQNFMIVSISTYPVFSKLYRVKNIWVWELHLICVSTNQSIVDFCVLTIFCAYFLQ